MPPPTPDEADAPLFDGLVVPPGAALAGAVFSEPHPSNEPTGATVDLELPDTRTATLTVDEDPFAVWDHLAAQLRSADPPTEMAGSADSCTWRYPDGAYPEVHGEGETMTVAQSDRWLEITADAPDPRAVGVECQASAPVPGERIGHTIAMAIVATDRIPMALSLTSEWHPAEWDAAAYRQPTARLTGFRDRVADHSPGSPPVPAPGPGTVPGAAAANLPEIVAQPDPAPGEPFGGEVNCFASGGGPTTTLPDGAELVVDTWASGDVSIVAVDDAASAMAELRRQFEGDSTDPSGSAVLEVLDLEGGQQVSRYRHFVTGGGGSCGVLESPDGRFLRISRHAD